MNVISVAELIEENKFVETRVSNYPNWISSQIIKAESELLLLELNEEHLKMLLTIGDTINIKFTSKEVEYVLTGFVESMIVAEPPKAVIKINKITRHDDGRKSARYNINLLCRIVPSDEQFKIQGITTDISETGISIVSYADFNIMDIVEVEVIAPQISVLNFKGYIKRLEGSQDNHIRYGIEIVEIDNENTSILHKIISSIENK